VLRLLSDIQVIICSLKPSISLVDVQRVFGDLSIDMDIDNMDPSSRMIDPELAGEQLLLSITLSSTRTHPTPALNVAFVGGAILDLGPYSLNFILLSLFPHPAPIPAASISASMVLTDRGVDLCTAATRSYIILLPSAVAGKNGKES
jgi:hypothetical protein